jgi:hypothetical protein
MASLMTFALAPPGNAPGLDSDRLLAPNRITFIFKGLRLLAESLLFFYNRRVEE